MFLETASSTKIKEAVLNNFELGNGIVFFAHKGFFK